MTAEQTLQRNAIAKYLSNRIRVQGWRKANGQLTVKGNEASLEFIIGAASMAYTLEQHNLASALNFLAFLGSTRGAGDEAERLLAKLDPHEADALDAFMVKLAQAEEAWRAAKEGR